MSGSVPEGMFRPDDPLDSGRAPNGSVVASVALPASARPSAAFTRPNDAVPYAVGDLVANSTSAGSVVPLALTAARVPTGAGQLLRAMLRKSGANLVNAAFRVHFFAAAPTVAAGDNAALAVAGANYMGAVEITMDRAFTDGALGIGGPLTGAAMVFVCQAEGRIHALVEARGAYTPAAAEVFTLVAEVVRD